MRKYLLLFTFANLVGCLEPRSLSSSSPMPTTSVAPTPVSTPSPPPLPSSATDLSYINQVVVADDRLQTDHSPLFASRVLFEKPGSHLAFPQMVVGQDGTVFLFVNQATNHYASCNDGVVSLKKSSDGGRTWGEAKVVFSSQGKSLGINSVTSRGGMLFATLMIRQYPESCNHSRSPAKSFFLMSSANGTDWQQFNEIKSMPYGTPLFNALGDLLISSYWGGEYTAAGRRSPAGNLINGSGLLNIDKAQSINALPFEQGSATFAFSETAYLKIDNDSIYAVARGIKNFFSPPSRDYFLFESFSRDSGFTWSAPKTIARGGPAELIRLADGAIVRCFTYRKVYYVSDKVLPLILEDENPLPNGGVYCQLSRDRAVSWTAPKPIHINNRHWDIGYAEGVQVSDGRILISIYDNDGVGTPEDLRSSTSIGGRSYQIRLVEVNTAFFD